MPRPLPLRRIVKPCHFRHLPSHLPPIFSTLARPSLNPFPCYLFPPAGGRVPLVYPERSRRVNQPSLFAVDCRLSAVGQFRATSLISLISPAYGHRPCKSLVSPTYAKTGGCTPTRKCRRADIFDFSPYILHFSCSERGAKGSSPRARLRRRPLQNRRRRPKAAPTRKAGHGARATPHSSGHGSRATHQSSPACPELSRRVAGHWALNGVESGRETRSKL